MIELKNISKQYCKETTILKDIDLCIEDGDYIALMGPSGAGKTTLMNIMGCLDRATQGEYFLDGNEISDYPEKEKARLRNEKFGFVVQDFALINEMTVYENVRLPLRYRKKRLKKEIRRQLKAFGGFSYLRYAVTREISQSAVFRRRALCAVLGSWSCTAEERVFLDTHTRKRQKQPERIHGNRIESVSFYPDKC